MRNKPRITLSLIIILSGLLFTSTMIGINPQTEQRDNFASFDESFSTAQFAQRSIRVAIYNESDTSLPSYMPAGFLTNNYENVKLALVAAGFDVDILTTQDILDFKLNTASYDILVIVDQLPRDSITLLVKEYWLGGGGILSFNSAFGYLSYYGFLDPMWEGDTGLVGY